jgi:hypothetical protein
MSRACGRLTDFALKAQPPGTEFLDAETKVFDLATIVPVHATEEVHDEGVETFIVGIVRYCLWISDEDLDLATSIPFIRGRLQKTKTVRLESRDPGYNKLASTPHKYRDTNTHIGHSIILPTISSERREIFPVGMVDGGRLRPIRFLPYTTRPCTT